MSLYKVVKRVGVNLYSSCVYGEAQVLYLPGVEEEVWIEAPEWLAELGYYLTVFVDLDVARNFAEQLYIVGEIWECDYGGVFVEEGNLPRCRSPYDVSMGVLGNKEFKWFPGTYMCERLRLIDLVERIR